MIQLRIINVLQCALIGVCGCGQSELEKASSAESRAACGEALGHYAAALLKAAHVRPIPDKSDSRILSPQRWLSEVTRYIDWVGIDSAASQPSFASALAGIHRCAATTPGDIQIEALAASPASVHSLVKLWEEIFFALPPSFDESHRQLIDAVMRGRLSVITLISSRDFTYDGYLLNTISGRALRFLLYPESRVSFIARPGKHLVLCRSKVAFPRDRIWISTQSCLDLTVPQNSSIVTGELRTRVRRETAENLADSSR